MPGGEGCLDHKIGICLHEFIDTPQHHSRGEYIGASLDALSIQAARYFIRIDKLKAPFRG
jgi:hypothetical protein